MSCCSETLHLNIYVKYHACIKPLQKKLLNGYVNVNLNGM